MGHVSLPGMSSGLDTNSIISQLVLIEAQAKSRFVKQEKYATGRKTALDAVAGQLRALSTAMSDLRSATTWGDVQKVTSSDPTKLDARVVGSAPSGNVTVRIDRMARAEQRVYATASLPTGAATINGVSVNLTGATTPEEYAAKINAASGAPYAGVVNGELWLTSRNAGEAIAFRRADATEVTDDALRRVAAQRTEYYVNEVRQADTVSGVVQPAGLAGVELTLKAVGSSTLAISAPAVDADKVTTKVKAFVDAYNATIDLVRGKLSEDKVKNPMLSTDFAKGALRNDPALSGLLSRLRQTVQPVDGTSTIDTLAELGVTVPSGISSGGVSSAEALAGKLSFDAGRFKSALASAPADVKAVLGATSGVSGAIGALVDLVDPVARTATGTLAVSASNADAEAARMRTRQTDMDRRLKLKEERLREQFTALETALSKSNSQGGWLQGQIAGLRS